MTTTPTNPQESEPREFWISEHRKGRNISNRIDIFTAVESEPENPGWLHVIEFAAYSKLKAELTQANIAFEQIEKMNEYVCKQRDELKAELAEKSSADLVAEKYRLREQLAEARAEIERWRLRCMDSDDTLALQNELLTTLASALEKNKSEWEAVSPDGHMHLVAWQQTREALAAYESWKEKLRGP